MTLISIKANFGLRLNDGMVIYESKNNYLHFKRFKDPST